MILEEFKNMNITKKELQKEFGQDLYNADAKNQVVISTCDVINAINKYLNHEVTKKRLVEWVNVVWFTDLFTYNEEQEDSISSVMSELEQLDEPEQNLSNDDFIELIICLGKNIEYIKEGV